MEENSNKKNRAIVPILLLSGGILLAGGLIVLALMNSKKNDQVKTLEQKLTGTEINYYQERDSLSKVLKEVTDRYNIVTAENGTLSDNLSKEQIRNNRLANNNSAYATREKKYKYDYEALKKTLDKNNAEKETLISEAGSMHSQMESLQAQIADLDKHNSEQSAVISDQAAMMQSDSSATASLLDSLRREDVSGYFNNTELTGAFGLRDISVPYSHYYWGITTINGYVINKHFLTGIGVGLSYYDAGWMAPLYLDVRYTFNKRKFTPYIFTDSGVLFDLEKLEQPNCLFFNPGFGVYRTINDHLTLNLGAGLFVQRFDARSSFINIKLGLMFKK